MTTRLQSRSAEFRGRYTEERAASFCFCMTRQSSRICANHPVTDWKPSRATGEVFIQFASMISGESFFGGKMATLLKCKSLITTDSGGLFMRQPTNPFHPGEILLEEFLNPTGITQTAFAEKIGWTRARLNELINGKRGITADAALDLAEALGTTAKLWMNLQATYDLNRAKKRREQVA